MNSERKPSFVFLETYYSSVEEFKIEEQMLMLEAVIRYGLYDEMPVGLNLHQRALFKSFMGNLDSSKQRYKNSIENGKKGGRPRKYPEPNQTSENLTETLENREIPPENPIENLKTPEKPTKNQNNQTISPENLNKDKDMDLDKDKDLDKDMDKDFFFFSEEAEAEAEADPPPDSPIFIELPLNDNSHYAVTEKMVAKQQALYPALDMHQQFRSMKGWLESNPDRGKPKKEICRFINGWLTSELQKSGKAMSSPKAEKEKLCEADKQLYREKQKWDDAWLDSIEDIYDQNQTEKDASGVQA